MDRLGLIALLPQPRHFSFPVSANCSGLVSQNCSRAVFLRLGCQAYRPTQPFLSQEMLCRLTPRYHSPIAMSIEFHTRTNPTLYNPCVSSLCNTVSFDTGSPSSSLADTASNRVYYKSNDAPFSLKSACVDIDRGHSGDGLGVQSSIHMLDAASYSVPIV